MKRVSPLVVQHRAESSGHSHIAPIVLRDPASARSTRGRLAWGVLFRGGMPTLAQARARIVCGRHGCDLGNGVVWRLREAYAVVGNTDDQRVSTVEDPSTSTLVRIHSLWLRRASDDSDAAVLEAVSTSSSSRRFPRVVPFDDAMVRSTFGVENGIVGLAAALCRQSNVAALCDYLSQIRRNATREIGTLGSEDARFIATVVGRGQAATRAYRQPAEPAVFSDLIVRRAAYRMPSTQLDKATFGLVGRRILALLFPGQSPSAIVSALGGGASMINVPVSRLREMWSTYMAGKPLVIERMVVRLSAPPPAVLGERPPTYVAQYCAVLHCAPGA